jgi:hypothetical protein
MLQRDTQHKSSKKGNIIEDVFLEECHSYYYSCDVATASFNNGTAIKRLDIAV